jgi:probable phosphoglycerate mutase
MPSDFPECGEPVGIHDYQITMELILVRHGLPVRRENTVGPADPELAPDGHAQAKHMADYLSLEHIDALYSSPLKRAFQTAEPLAANKGLHIEVDPGVAEWDKDANEYIPIEELKRTNDPRWQEMMAGGWSSQEQPQEFEDRVMSSLETIIKNHSGQTIVVTCHGGVINLFLSKVLGLGESQFFYPNYTSIHRIAASSKGHRSILSVNETPHLRGTGLPIGLFHS